MDCTDRGSESDKLGFGVCFRVAGFKVKGLLLKNLGEGTSIGTCSEQKGASLSLYLSVSSLINSSPGCCFMV